MRHAVRPEEGAPPRWMRLIGGALLGAVLLASCATSRGVGQEAPPRLVHPELELAAEPPIAYERFGHAVAGNDSWLAIGAWGNAENGRDAGAVYVYRREGGAWVPDARLAPGDARAGAKFGFALAMDGDTLAVGAANDDGAGPRAGAVYVFEHRPEGWVETAKLVAPEGEDPELNDYGGFGSSVAIDGDVLATVAPATGRGETFVFERAGAGWELAAALRAGPKTEPLGNLRRVAVSDGLVAVAAFDLDDASGGAVHLFGRGGGGWELRQVLTEAVPGRHFAFDIALADDLLVVGAPGADSPGVALVFAPLGGEWSLLAQLTPEDAAFQFGASVATDGTRILVGGPDRELELPNVGHALLYAERGGEWRQVLELRPSRPQAELAFGVSVTVAAGGYAAGATGAAGADGAAEAAGAVFVGDLDAPR